MRFDGASLNQFVIVITAVVLKVVVLPFQRPHHQLLVTEMLR
jgi:hypothetical protein